MWPISEPGYAKTYVTHYDHQARFYYDADGNRVVSINDGARNFYVGDWIEAGTSYYHLGGQRVAKRTTGGVTYLHGDHLGSTSKTTGAASSAQLYEAYGAKRGSSEVDTPYRYTGQRWEENDALDIYTYKARWYDPALGRFLQPDTIVPESGNPQTLNRYAYGLNNPVKYTDPTGYYVFENTPDDPLFRPPTSDSSYAVASWTMPGEYNVELFILQKLQEMVAASETAAIQLCNSIPMVLILGDQDWMPMVAVNIKTTAYDIWVDQVDTNEPWDFKEEVRDRYKGRDVKIGPRQFGEDIVANITYGYAGREAGFSALELKGGAGLQQVYQHVYRQVAKGEKPRWENVGGVGSYGDDPRDQAAIQIGIDLHNRYGLQVSIPDLQNTVYAHAYELFR